MLSRMDRMGNTFIPLKRVFPKDILIEKFCAA